MSQQMKDLVNRIRLLAGTQDNLRRKLSEIGSYFEKHAVL